MKTTRTAYQKAHQPISTREVLCTETRTDDGFCVACHRYSGQDRIRSGHRPNARGALGFVEVYGDGSEYTTDPESEAE